MPIYYFKCPACGSSKRKLLKPAQVTEQTCDCGAKLERDPRPPGSIVMEKLDNGLQPRAIERFAEVERMIRDRNRDAG